MNNQFNDSDFDNLMSAGELGLPPLALAPEPAPIEVPRRRNRI